MTLVDVETGALVVVPRPNEVVDVYDLCSRVEMAIPNVEDIAEATDVKAKLAAIDAYLAQTSKDGRARLAGVMRRLEARIGELLGAARETQGRRTDLSVTTDKLSELSKHERNEFRQMAAHPEIVEKVIADSTDAEPPSRRKVVQAIRAQTKHEEVEVPVDTTSNASVERVRVAKQMAAEGYTSRQIANKIGIGLPGMSAFKKRHGIDVPADAVTGRTHLPDPNRFVRETVLTIESATSGLLGQVPRSELDPTEIDGWCQSLSESIQTLRKFLKELM